MHSNVLDLLHNLILNYSITKVLIDLTSIGTLLHKILLFYFTRFLVRQVTLLSLIAQAKNIDCVELVT